MSGGDAPSDPPPLASPEPRGLRQTVARSRTPAKWACGVLLVIDMFALLFVLSFANVTAEGPAQRGLAHSIAILTEVDAYLDDHYESLRAEAAEAPEEPVELAGFPVPLSFDAQDVQRGDREDFRALLLEEAARVVHADGVSVMREGRPSEVTFFSTQGAVRTGMDFLRPTPHRVLVYVSIGYAAVAGLLAAGVFLAARGYGKVIGPGLAVLFAATSFLVVAIAVRFALRVAADGVDDYLAREFLELGQELTWAPIRNGIIFAVGGGAVFLAGLVLAAWNDLRLRRA